jgi:hypothetical protein
MKNFMQYAKAHKLKVGLIGFVGLILIATVVSLLISSWSTEQGEKDPASGLTDYIVPETNSAGDELVEYFWPNEIYASHSDTWIQAVKTATTLYARQAGIELKRVSLYQDGYSHTYETGQQLDDGFWIDVDKEIYDLKVAINIDQLDLSVRLIRKYSRSDELSGFSVSIFDFSGTEVLALQGSENNWIDRIIPVGVVDLPDSFTSSPATSVLNLTEEDITNMKLNNIAPPLAAGDRVKLYYACPNAPSNSAETCQVYRYDFYF